MSVLGIWEQRSELIVNTLYFSDNTKMGLLHFIYCSSLFDGQFCWLHFGGKILLEEKAKVSKTDFLQGEN